MVWPMKKTLREIIESVGTCEFARRCAVDQSYVSKVRRGLRPTSVDLLGRAKFVFGDELDVDASIQPVNPRGDSEVVNHGQA